MQPHGLRNIQRPAFSTMDARSETSIEKLCEKACELVDNNLECMKTNADENAWGTDVVQKALEWETSGAERTCTRPSFSRVLNM